MVDMATMLQGHKDMVKERDAKIEEMTNSINEEYAKKLSEHKQAMHKELDGQIRGLS